MDIFDELGAQKRVKIAILGLGYVGLPLAIAFAAKTNVVAFDINQTRVNELKNNLDTTNEAEKDELSRASNSIEFTTNPEALRTCNFFIVTVPTPIDDAKNPDLSALTVVSEMLSGIIKRGDCVVFESTVYPGVTETICSNLLEKYSGMKVNEHFGVGYSPERINPGDKTKRVENIIKLVSGSNQYWSDYVEKVYSEIITAGTYKVSSIKVAEAAKVIENIQRDVNIALINELAIIFSKLDINTQEVLAAADTKWNFVKYSPGLVGGHCIGVDPYYLIHRAKQLDLHPELIQSGRRTNDSMSQFVASEFAKAIISRQKLQDGIKVLVLGLTFKENCPDTRNSQSLTLVQDLKEYGFDVHCYDPYVARTQITDNINILPNLNAIDNLAGIIIAVKHNEFVEFGVNRLKRLMVPNGILYDLKSTFDPSEVDKSL